jgi:hypothetical protein
LVQWDPTVAHIQLKDNSADHSMRQVVVAAQKEGISIKSLNILEPTLETVLLHLTGRSPQIEVS